MTLEPHLEPDTTKLGETMSLRLSTREQTKALGKVLGMTAPAGGMIALVGDLGAGKTTFTQGFCEGIGGIDPGTVTSPTFVLLQHYPGRLTVHHFDVYRLESLDAFWDLGPNEYWEGDGVTLVEWADRVGLLLPSDRLQLVLTHSPDGGREAQIQAMGTKHQEWLKKAKRNGL